MRWRNTLQLLVTMHGINLDPANNSASDPNSMRGDRYQIPDYVQPYLDGTPGLINTDWLGRYIPSGSVSELPAFFNR